MTCHELDERLDDFMDGALAGASAREVESHLAGCAACRERERQLSQRLAHAAALPRGVAPERGLWPGIAERIERGSGWSALWTSCQPLGIAAAAAVLLALAALLWNGSGPTAVRTVAMPSASPALRPVAGTGIADPELASPEPPRPPGPQRSRTRAGGGPGARSGLRVGRSRWGAQGLPAGPTRRDPQGERGTGPMA